jgi:hypothetical protein
MKEKTWNFMLIKLRNRFNNKKINKQLKTKLIYSDKKYYKEVL